MNFGPLVKRRLGVAMGRFGLTPRGQRLASVSKPLRIDPLPEPQPFPAARYIFAVGAIPRRYAGRTASVLVKAKAFAERAGVPCEILTMNLSAELEDITREIELRGALGAGVKIENLYDHFMRGALSSEPVIHPVEEAGMGAIKDPDAQVFRYYRNGVYRLYKRFDNEGRLLIRDSFNENRGRTRRDDFGPDGRIRRTTYYDLHYNRPRQEVYFRPDGTAFMNKWLVVNPADMSTSVERVTLFDEEERPSKVLTSHIELIHEYLDRVIGDDHVFLTIESRRTDPEVLGYRRPNVKRISVLHNPHTMPPFTNVRRIRPTYQPVLEHHADADAIVFLTAAQRGDAEAKYGAQANFAVIPHPVQLPAMDVTQPRDPNLVVMLARLDPQKQLDHAIRAFKKTLIGAPTARLEIYGRGPDETSLRELIRTLHLEDSVELKGYTTDPAAVYRRASACLLTSQYEGFGLVLLEAIANGCPVVSYDISYGPADIVEDGVTGYLVPQGDLSAVASALIRIVQDSGLRDRLSASCRASAERFTEDAFLARWAYLFNQLDAQGWD